MIETWILLVSVWIIQPDNTFKEEQYRAEFSTMEACRDEGRKRIIDAGQNPATWFCKQKGVDVNANL